ncbi:unnamed protein product [Coregonus sp. 'balchen']|nr:unnamed protein product [Coregonus sp. 'balchen']
MSTANIHAGSAFLATGGVCMLGDLGHYRKNKMDALHFCALAESTAPSKKTIRTDNVVLGTADMRPVPAQLAEAFGLVIQCRETGESTPCSPRRCTPSGRQCSPESPSTHPACSSPHRTTRRISLAEAHSKLWLRSKLLEDAVSAM